MKRALLITTLSVLLTGLATPAGAEPVAYALAASTSEVDLIVLTFRSSDTVQL